MNAYLNSIEKKTTPLILAAEELQMGTNIDMERVKYNLGQLLSVSDFTTEQEYFLSKHRRHNRYLHGWGVVNGLNVSIVTSSEILVDPGVAIDCAGNEIYVCSPLRVNIPTNSDVCFVVLQYAESETSPIPISIIPAPASSEELIFTRIKDGYLIDIAAVDPTTGHRGKGTGTPGCGCLHQLCIARLKKGLHGWKIQLKGRRPR